MLSVSFAFSLLVFISSASEGILRKEEEPVGVYRGASKLGDLVLFGDLSFKAEERTFSYDVSILSPDARENVLHLEGSYIYDPKTSEVALSVVPGGEEAYLLATLTYDKLSNTVQFSCRIPFIGEVSFSLETPQPSGKFHTAKKIGFIEVNAYMSVDQENHKFSFTLSSGVSGGKQEVSTSITKAYKAYTASEGEYVLKSRGFPPVHFNEASNSVRVVQSLWFKNVELTLEEAKEQ